MRLLHIMKRSVLLTVLPAVSTFGSDNIEGSYTAAQSAIQRFLSKPVPDPELPLTDELLATLQKITDSPQPHECHSPQHDTGPKSYKTDTGVWLYQNTTKSWYYNNGTECWYYNDGMFTLFRKYRFDGNKTIFSETPFKSKEQWDKEQQPTIIALYHSFNTAISYFSNYLKQLEKDKDLLWTYKHAAIQDKTGKCISLEDSVSFTIPGHDEHQPKTICIPSTYWYQAKNIRNRLGLLCILDIMAYSKKMVFPTDTIDSYKDRNALALNRILCALIESLEKNLRVRNNCKNGVQHDNSFVSTTILSLLKNIKSYCPTEIYLNITYHHSTVDNQMPFQISNIHNKLKSKQEKFEKALIGNFNDYATSAFNHIKKAIDLNKNFMILANDCAPDTYSICNIMNDILSGYPSLKEIKGKYKDFLNNRCFQLTHNRKIIFQGNPLYLDVFLKKFYQHIESEIQNIPRTELIKFLNINKQLLQDVAQQEKATEAVDVQGQHATPSATASEPQRQGTSHKKRKRGKRKVNIQPQPQQTHSPEKQYEEKLDEVAELTLTVPSFNQSVDSLEKRRAISTDEFNNELSSDESDNRLSGDESDNRLSSDKSTDELSSNQSDHSDNQASTNELSSDESDNELSNDGSDDVVINHADYWNSYFQRIHNFHQQRKQEEAKNNHSLNLQSKIEKIAYEIKNNHLSIKEQIKKIDRKIEKTSYKIKLYTTLLERVFHPSQGMKPTDLKQMFADLKFVVQPNRKGKGSQYLIFPAPDNPLFGDDKHLKNKIKLHFPTGSESFVYKYFDVLKKEFAGLFGLTKEYMEDNLPLLQERLSSLYPLSSSLHALAAKDKGKEKEKETAREEKKEKEPEKQKPRSSPNKKNKTNHKHNRKHKK